MTRLQPREEGGVRAAGGAETGDEQKTHRAEQQHGDPDGLQRTRYAGAGAKLLDQGMAAREEAEHDPPFREKPRHAHAVGVLLPVHAEAARRSLLTRSARIVSASRNASSSAWLALSRGSQAVW